MYRVFSINADAHISSSWMVQDEWVFLVFVCLFGFFFLGGGVGMCVG